MIQKPSKPAEPAIPQAPDAERGVLACVLLEPITVMDYLTEEGVTGAWFYEPAHATLWGRMDAMHKAGTMIDLVTLMGALRQAGEIEKIGGETWLLGLADAVPSAAAVRHYLPVVRDRHQLRGVIACGTRMSMAAKDPEAKAEVVLADAEKEVLLLAEERAGQREIPIYQLLEPVFNRLEDYHRGHAQIRGISSGIECIDKYTLGYGGGCGNFNVISGRPGTGKTSMALQLAMHAALDYEWWTPKLDASGARVLNEDKEPVMEKRKGVPVGIFSLEMNAMSLCERMLFSRAEADIQRWRTGFAKSATEMPKLESAMADLAACKVYVDDIGRATIDEIKAKARRWKRTLGIQMFVLDYIQLVRTGGRRFRDDRVQELMEISGELQALGKELNTPWLILAQMNRDYEKDVARTPRLSDLKDCGAIEQDADTVTFLYEPKLKGPRAEEIEQQLDQVYAKDWSAKPMYMRAYVAKNRYGPGGNAEILFHKSSTRFEDWNDWLKRHGLKAPAQGERKKSDGAKEHQSFMDQAADAV